MIYLDASAIVKLVVEEAETEALRSWLGRRRSPRVTSDISRIEVPRACMRAQPTAVLEAQRAVARFNTVPLSRRMLARAASLQPPELRSLDAVHLASALGLRSHLRAFVAYDPRLVDAARAARLPIERPS
ncbi:MAG TPA: type II toxin-antitoxin system VapC family toxin [Acidimicrobiales bacterium]|jgi:predicted nucleic acid-binding protein|nr:type II toxin-antitoxin system VapC family toxin [Acidimicrobiales bacterium]